MSVDRAKFKAEAQACLGQSKPAGELVEWAVVHGTTLLCAHPTPARART